MYFYIFVYWPPFHVFHINLDKMECFVKFSPSLYSCQTHHLALLKPPFLPNKVHSLFCIFFCSWTRKYKLVIQLNTQHTMLSHKKQKHTTAATRVLGRAKRDVGGTVWVRGWGCATLPSLLQIL